MSSNSEDDNTEVAVIGTPPPSKLSQDTQGRPTIGKNFYINRGKEDEDEASTLSSISGGTNISKAQFGGFAEQYDVESGVAVENNTFEVIYGRENSYTDDKSSLSSLTDNFPSKGRFATFGRKGALATFGFQTQLDNIVDTSPSREKKDPNRSPWYVQSSQHIETNAIPTLGQGSDNTSSSSSIINIPEKELMTSFTRDHLDDLVRYPPSKPPLNPPPLQRLSSSCQRRASDLDSSRAGRSEGFLTYVEEKYIRSRRKKLISIVVVVFFVCVIVIVAVAFNTQNNSNVNKEEANTIYQVEQPHELENGTLSDLSSVEHDDTEDVSSDILTTDPTKQIPQVQVTESAATSTTTTNSSQAETTTTTTTSDTPSTSTDPTTPGWLNDLSALDFTTTTSTTTTMSTTSSTTTTSTQKTPTFSPTSKRPSLSPSISSTESPTTAPALPSLSLKAISDTSIFKNRPTKNFATASYLAVKNDAKASSFVRFDISNTSGNAVSKAILRLYSIVSANTDSSEVIGGLSNINVDTLPLAGKWDESTITYDTPAESSDAFTVGSFSVEGYPHSENSVQRIHEVDVTAAFRNSADAEGFTTVSFMLYSDETSTGRVDFASNEWGEGFNGPELVIELSDTTYPTKSPSTSSPTSTSSSVRSTLPSSTPSNECTLKCEEDAIAKFDREIDKLVDKCIDETAFNENCIQDAKKCKKECEKDAEKREEDVLEKVNNDAIKCKEICQNNAPDDTPLAVDRDVAVVVNHKLSKQDKSAPDETEFRLMELFP